jgi:thioredoxin 1
MRKLFFMHIGLAILAACSGSKSAPKPTPRPKPPVAQHTQSTPPAAPVSDRLSIPVKSDATHIQWVDSDRLMPVLEEAQRLQKNVFVAFEASWCAPCKVMESEIFSQSAVYELYNRKFINFKTDFDSETGKTIAQIYEVEKLPTVLILNPQGVVLERYLGMATATRMQEMANKY